MDNFFKYFLLMMLGVFIAYLFNDGFKNDEPQKDLIDPALVKESFSFALETLFDGPLMLFILPLVFAHALFPFDQNPHEGALMNALLEAVPDDFALFFGFVTGFNLFFVFLLFMYDRKTNAK